MTLTDYAERLVADWVVDRMRWAEIGLVAAIVALIASITHAVCRRSAPGCQAVWTVKGRERRCGARIEEGAEYEDRVLLVCQRCARDLAVFQEHWRAKRAVAS